MLSYFVAWIDQLIAGAEANKDWNTDAEKATVLEQLCKPARFTDVAALTSCSLTGPRTGLSKSLSFRAKGGIWAA